MVVLNKKELFAKADRTAKAMLGISARKAFNMVARGELRGTIAEAEMQKFRLLIDSAR